MEPELVDFTYVTLYGEESINYVVKGGEPIMFSDFYDDLDYPEWLIIRPLVKTRRGYVAEKASTIAELERWLNYLATNKNKTLRAKALDILLRITNMRGYVGQEISRLLFEEAPRSKVGPTKAQPSTPTKVSRKSSTTEPSSKPSVRLGSPMKEVTSEDDEDYMALATPFKNLTLGSPSRDAEMKEVEPKSYTPSVTRVQPPRVQTPPREPKKRVRQATPPGKSTSAKKHKPIAKTNAQSAWVSNETFLIRSDTDDLVTAMLETIIFPDSDIVEDSLEFWQFMLHPPVKSDDEFVTLTSDFTDRQFWKWFDKVYASFSDSGYAFDFETVDQNRTVGMHGEFLVDEVITQATRD